MADHAKRLKYAPLMGIFSVLLAGLTTELLGINRLVHRFVQRDRDFVKLELVLVTTLCALMILLAFKRREHVYRSHAVHFVLFGVAAGVLSGILAMASLSVFNYDRAGFFQYTSSWSDVVGFIVASTLQTFGWLIGLLSGLYLTLMFRRALR